MSTIEATVILEKMHCAGCSMLFAATEQFVERRRADHKTFYCPAGCHNHFPGETEEEKLRRRLADQTAARAKAEEEARRAAARIAAGVCPCCSRTFKQLSRHIAAKHPHLKEQTA